jgi:hypothetical protein
MESTTATCAGGTRSPNAASELSAHSAALVSLDHLAELGASADITVDTSDGFSDPLRRLREQRRQRVAGA